jgi:hypothetical protein
MLAAAGPLVAFGTLDLASYLQDITSVTVTNISWAIVSNGVDQHEYLISCQFSCPTHAHPGSDYSTVLEIAAVSPNQTANLSVPSPFEIVSSAPALPAEVPQSGEPVTVVIMLPDSPGTYNCTGTVNLY